MLNKVLSVIAKSTSDARFAGGTEQPLVSTNNKFLSVGFLTMASTFQTYIFSLGLLAFQLLF